MDKIFGTCTLSSHQKGVHLLNPEGINQINDNAPQKRTPGTGRNRWRTGDSLNLGLNLKARGGCFWPFLYMTCSSFA